MSRRKSLSGIDFERYQEQNTFKKRLQTCLIAFGKWRLESSEFGKQLYPMLRTLNAPTIDDVGRLPYEGYSFRTTRIRPELQLRRVDKYRCLITCTAFIILQYWQYQSMLCSSGRINHMINYLENIVDEGLSVFEVRGNVRKGWRLHG